jgi:hypothetical protein
VKFKPHRTGGAKMAATGESKQVSIHVREDSDSELQALFDISLKGGHRPLQGCVAFPCKFFFEIFKPCFTHPFENGIAHPILDVVLCEILKPCFTHPFENGITHPILDVV